MLQYLFLTKCFSDIKYLSQLSRKLAESGRNAFYFLHNLLPPGTPKQQSGPHFECKRPGTPARHHTRAAPTLLGYKVDLAGHGWCYPHPWQLGILICTPHAVKAGWTGQCKHFGKYCWAKPLQLEGLQEQLSVGLSQACIVYSSVEFGSKQPKCQGNKRFV